MNDKWVRLRTAIIDDPEFHELDADERLLVYTLMPALKRIAIGPVYPGQLPAQTALSAERVEAAAQSLEGRGWLRRQGHLWWLVKYGLDPDDFNPRNKNRAQGLVNRIDALPDCQLVREYREHNADRPGLHDTSEADRQRLIEQSKKTLRRVQEQSSKTSFPHGEDPSKTDSRTGEDPSETPFSLKKEKRGRKRETAFNALSQGECGLHPCICGQCSPQEKR